MRKLTYSRESISNLEQIYDYIKENFSRENAENVIHDIFAKISSLSEYPHLGKISEVSPFVRELIVEGNSIFYQITEQTIDIVFIKPRKSVLKNRK